MGGYWSDLDLPQCELEGLGRKGGIVFLLICFVGCYVLSTDLFQLHQVFLLNVFSLFAITMKGPRN